MARPGLLAVLLLGAAVAAAAAARPQRTLQSATSAPLTPFSKCKSKEEAFAALSYLVPSGVQAAVAGAAMPLDEAQLRKLYADWKLQFKQNYPTEAEDTRRYSIFAANVRRILANNAPGSRSKSWEVLNHFSALTAAEFCAQFTSQLRKPALKAADMQPPKIPKLRAVRAAAVVDWRTSGKVTPIKQQAQCGSCWAFSELAAIESKVLIATQTTAATNPIDLAEQQVLDCGSPGQDGCDGGTMHQTYAYIAAPL
ncbi:hypothetical protein ABPG75_013813 [Micractinium tetrahymenae]